VTWWDPRALALGVPPPFGLRRDDLIVKTGDMFGVDDRLAEYERWREARATVLTEAARPSVTLMTATAWAADAASKVVDTVIAESAAITVVELAGARDRPRGARFGTLVHAVLATVPLDAPPEIVAATAHTQARILNAPPEEARAAAAVASAVLGHDLVARARASTRARRETPVTWTQKDGTLIEGVLDLAFDEEDRTIVVDFKTDHELVTGETRYRAQLQQYVNAVARATGRETSGVLFTI
jgi:ATP-dependent exoDNAse (exonuclease V) beta subunit